MVSSYTQNNGIEKPGIGEQSNTWGNTANNNYDILDRAANGVGTVALTGTSSNLTTSDGILSDGQYNTLVFTGALGATHTVTVLPNDLRKLYTVYNLTGQSLIFTQGSGGNVTLANGDSAIIYCSGTGATSAIVNIADHLAMSSPRITGGSISGLSAPLAVVDGGSGSTTASGARTAFGLGTMATLNTGTAGGEFRTNTQNASTFQPLDATLTAYAGFSGAADVVPYFTGTDALASMTVTTAARTVLDDVSTSAMLTTLGAQPSGATLTSLEGLSLVAGDILYATGPDTLVRLAAGADRTFLKSAAGTPAWASDWTYTSPVTLAGVDDDFTGIPAGVTEVRFFLDGISLSGSSQIAWQLGTSGSFATSGYSNMSGTIDLSAVGVTDDTTQFVVFSGSATSIARGFISFVKGDGNDWFVSGMIRRNSNAISFLSGSVSLGGVLTRIKVKSQNGTDTFDSSGQAYIAYR
jgi:hypothetical protein